jgi:hypothetical protein
MKNWDDISFTNKNKNTVLEFVTKGVLPQQSAATIKPMGAEWTAPNETNSIA